MVGASDLLETAAGCLVNIVFSGRVFGKLGRQKSTYSGFIALRAFTKLALAFCHCQAWIGLTTRAVCSPVNSRDAANMGRYESGCLG